MAGYPQWMGGGSRFRSSYQHASRLGNYAGARMFGGWNQDFYHNAGWGEVIGDTLPGILGQAAVNALLSGGASLAGSVLGSVADDFVNEGLYYKPLAERSGSDIYSDEVNRGREYLRKHGSWFPTTSSSYKVGVALKEAEKKYDDSKKFAASYYSSRYRKRKHMSGLGGGARLRRGFGSRPVRSFAQNFIIREGPFLR